MIGGAGIAGQPAELIDGLIDPSMKNLERWFRSFEQLEFYL